MFNMIDIGERAGSGVPELFSVWKSEGWEEPAIDERFDPDRTILTLVFRKKRISKISNKSDEKKRQKKAPEKSAEKKVTKKTQMQYNLILSFMQYDIWYKAIDLMDILNVKETRTKELLRALVAKGDLIDDGETKGKKYKKVK